jgi:DNA-binding PadR family transcriptional regulator
MQVKLARPRRPVVRMLIAFLLFSRYDILDASKPIQRRKAMGLTRPVPKSRAVAVKLRPPSFLVLGMLRLGAKSGYAIKKATDISTRFFWSTSLAQVYPELSRLDDAGLVDREEDPRGARARSSYEVTAEGEEALLSWLRSPREAPPQFRSEGVLRLFLADALPREDQLALVRRLLAGIRETEAEMRAEILPLAEDLEGEGWRYPAVVARLGADTYAYAIEWLERLESELES